MTDANEKKLGGKGRIFLRCFKVQLEVEVEAHMRVTKAAGQASENPAIDDQSDIIEGETVEDIDPAEVETLDKI